MPIYEYKCQKCGKTTEVMQKFSDKLLSRCPACSGKVSKIISESTFHLKGTGWYVTDYKGGKSAQNYKHMQETKEKAADTPKSETTSSKSGDSK